jgi:hypothetical protein
MGIKQCNVPASEKAHGSAKIVSIRKRDASCLGDTGKQIVRRFSVADARRAGLLGGRQLIVTASAEGMVRTGPGRAAMAMKAAVAAGKRL